MTVSLLPPIISSSDPFPPINTAWGDSEPAPGLLCVGADLSVERLLTAYRLGIFPWFGEGEPILWWSPNPRMVLMLEAFKVSRSLQRTLRKFAENSSSHVSMDKAFPAVIAHCAQTARPGQNGTWIVPAMQAAYIRLHQAGFAHSIEVWVSGQLVGGLYFTQVGRAVFGESMFSLASDASKIALAHLVTWCKTQGIEWIDCQQQTSHLASLGALPIRRETFLTMLLRSTHEN